MGWAGPIPEGLISFNEYPATSNQELAAGNEPREPLFGKSKWIFISLKFS
jgi:hypothetical protein